MKTWITAILMSVALVLPVTAQAGIIDFELDANGPVGNGFTSASDANVHFSDTNGAGLQLVSGIPECANTRCLAAFDDFDGSGIQIDFDFVLNALSFDYGNDQVFGENPAVMLMVTFLLNNVVVDTASVVPNFNDVMDQTFSYVGVAFNQAIVMYVGADGGPATLIETIDNLQFDVPAPGMLALFALGALWLTRRRS